MEGKNLYLKPQEAAFLGMAVMSMIDNLERQAKEQNLNWTPAARSTFREMLTAAAGLKVKMEKMGFDMRELPPFEEGDEQEYFTKQS